MDEVLELAADDSAAVDHGRSGARLVLGVAVVANDLLLVALAMRAVLVDRQSDILATRSQMRGFDPSVFPPFGNGIWLLSNGATVLTGVVLIALLAFCAVLRRGRAAPAI